MHALVLASALTLIQAAAAPETRQLRLSVADSKGRPVTDLQASEVAVVENGVARPVVRLSPDERKIVLALVVDTSAAVQDSYRLQIVPAITAVLQRLPAGTRVTAWTSGSRPTRIAEATADMSVVAEALKRVILDGGNTLFDTIDQAVDDLSAAEGARAILLIVTARGDEFSSRDRPRVLDDPKRLGATEVYAAEIEGPLTPIQSEPAMEERANYDRALSELARGSGGRVETTFSSLSLQPALDTVAKDLMGGYLLRYSTVAGLDKHEVEVQVARPGVKPRHASASRAE